MKIYAPVKDFNGVRNSVRFVNGVGETDNPSVIGWFESNGYKVEKPQRTSDEDLLNLIIETQNDKIETQNEQIEPNFDKMTPNELREWMREHGYGLKIKNTRNKEKLLEILRS